MERYIELHEGKSRSHKLDMKIEWIKIALDMRDNGDPNAPSLDIIKSYTLTNLTLSMCRFNAVVKINAARRKMLNFPFPLK